jgi:hypothetical protein
VVDLVVAHRLVVVHHKQLLLVPLQDNNLFNKFYAKPPRLIGAAFLLS